MLVQTCIKEQKTRDGGESGSDSQTRGSRAFFGDSIGSRLETQDSRVLENSIFYVKKVKKALNFLEKLSIDSVLLILHYILEVKRNPNN